MSDLPSSPPWDTEPVISEPVAVEPPAEAKPEKPPWVPSPDQQRAYDQILDWIDKKQKPVFTLGGLAGVGKTTLVGHLANDLMASMNVAFATPTGKAAQVLKRSLLKADVAADVTTIHSLLYRPIEDKKTGRVTGWSRRETVDADLIVVDEASMVSQEILNDLTKLNRPILAVGDHGQLSPVGEDAGLMKNPDVKLEKIHRQAKGNPIIRLAHMVRNGAPDDVIKDFIEDIDDERVRWTRGWDEAVHFGKPPGFVLSHTNRLRRTMNIRIREQVFGYDEHDDPKKGEVIICLKNKRLDDTGLFIPNGMRGVLVSEPHVSEHHVTADVQFDEPVGLVTGLVMCRHQFLREKTFAGFDEVPGNPRNWFTTGALCDYGSALTTHKSQGSSAPNVAVFVERSLGVLDESERRRWLYTATTRAVDRLLLVF
jgi:exodeoxyribonuclease-5